MVDTGGEVQALLSSQYPTAAQSLGLFAWVRRGGRLSSTSQGPCALGISSWSYAGL